MKKAKSIVMMALFTIILVIITDKKAAASTVESGEVDTTTIVVEKDGFKVTFTPEAFTIESIVDSLKLPCREISDEECHNNPAFERNYGFSFEIDYDSETLHDVAIYYPNKFTNATCFYGTASKVYQSLKNGYKIKIILENGTTIKL